MKLRNIFLLISCCFAALSCSMEDDTIMNDVEKDMDNMEEATTEMYTAIDFNLGLNEMTTKSTTITGGNPQLPNYNPDSTELNENYINSSKIFILENDQIIYIIDVHVCQFSGSSRIAVFTTSHLENHFFRIGFYLA